jgi:hypothetical protein
MILNINNLDGVEKAFLCEIFSRKKSPSTIETNFDMLSLYRNEFIEHAVNSIQNELTDEGKQVLGIIFNKLNVNK